MHPETQADMSNSRVIFLHIPKTAGTTLRQVIERQYKPTGIFGIDVEFIQKSIEEFNKLSTEQRSGIRLFRGHIWFGVHEFLPFPCSYFTLLRDPIDRIISHYYFVIRRPRHYLYESVVSQKMTLLDYVNSKISPELDNGQTRVLCGNNKLIPPGECTNEMLESAKKNLQQHFAAVGISEEFDKSLLLFKKTFGWNTPYYVKENVSTKRPLKSDIPREIWKSIERQNELDVELYKFGCEIFRNSLESQDRLFDKELERFRFMNHRLGGLFAFTTRMINKILFERVRVPGTRIEWYKSRF